MDTIRIQGFVRESIVDGPGIRFALFTQGCYHNCDGCHNPETHDINGGYDILISELLEKISENPLVTGVTLSGGEPLLQAEALCILCRGIKELGKHIMLYSGFTFEEILKLSDPFAIDLLTYADVLVDGKFILEQKNLELKFRGSENQRIIELHNELFEKFNN